MSVSILINLSLQAKWIDMANKTIISTTRISSIHTTHKKTRPSKNNPTKIRGDLRCSARVLSCWSCKYITSDKSYSLTCQNHASFEKRISWIIVFIHVDLITNILCFYYVGSPDMIVNLTTLFWSFVFLKIWIALICKCVRFQSNLLDCNDWGLCLDPRNAQINDTFTLLFYDQHT